MPSLRKKVLMFVSTTGAMSVRAWSFFPLSTRAQPSGQWRRKASYADGVLLRDAYIEKKKALSEKLAVLQDSIRTEKEEQECADELDEEIRALTKQASEKTYIGGLTKECVDAFVSMVYLYDDQTMKIEFNCEDVIRRALEKYGA